MQVRELLSFSPTPTPTPSSSSSSEITQDFGSKINLDLADSVVREMKFEEEEEDDVKTLASDDRLQNEEDDQDFSFICATPDGSPISADDAFYNGQIRPIYPLFNQDLLFAETNKVSTGIRTPLKKVFVEKREAEEDEELEGIPPGTYCEWSPESCPELGKKSNSTGFSKLWRFRDLVHRSSSDGKDAFVFLNNPSVAKKKEIVIEKEKEKEKRKSKGKQQVKKGETSAHERHYVRNRAEKEEVKRKSYLPYRQDLVGFFTTVNGFTKNVHPY